MYDDFKLCDKEEFEKIALEYSRKNKAQILGLSDIDKNFKKDFNNVLNMSARLYFDLKQREIKDFRDVLKHLKSINLDMAKVYKEKFLEEFLPNKDISLNKPYVNVLIDIIKNCVELLKYDNLDALRQNILKYMDIISLIFTK